MPSKRSAIIALGVGMVHAAALLGVALDLGYQVGPTAYSPLGAAWRYGGLVVLGAVPVWLALHYRVVLPLVALAVTTGYVLGMELTPPGPTFRDVAELERLAEPTGIIVIENGLYVVRYMVNASVWTLAFLLIGLVEYTARLSWSWLPGSPPRTWLSIPAARRQAVGLATAVGAVHAGVMLWFAVRLGLSVSGGLGWALYLVSTLGMWLLATIPVYLLVRHRLVAPATLLVAFVVLDARAEFTASVDDPHALYFGAWFLFLVVLLVAAGLEYGVRRAGLVSRSSPA
ncbi:hypothetical protein [Halorarius halobius]|uniref:hypothetical protein n=1 Tax=Halorarius halobius TaxID=2962671 RepID=UPI0020CF98C9|nr:hypothetical protein [Halorarius halobius]